MRLCHASLPLAYNMEMKIACAEPTEPIVPLLWVVFIYQGKMSKLSKGSQPSSRSLLKPKVKIWAKDRVLQISLLFVNQSSQTNNGACQGRAVRTTTTTAELNAQHPPLQNFWSRISTINSKVLFRQLSKKQVCRLLLQPFGAWNRTQQDFTRFASSPHL